VATTVEEACQAVDDMLVGAMFGEAGESCASWCNCKAFLIKDRMASGGNHVIQQNARKLNSVRPPQQARPLHMDCPTKLSWSFSCSHQER
jgi:hypothetical protein